MPRHLLPLVSGYTPLNVGFLLGDKMFTQVPVTIIGVSAPDPDNNPYRHRTLACRTKHYVRGWLVIVTEYHVGSLNMFLHLVEA